MSEKREMLSCVWSGSYLHTDMQQTWPNAYTVEWGMVMSMTENGGGSVSPSYPKGVVHAADEKSKTKKKEVKSVLVTLQLGVDHSWPTVGR